MFSILVSSSSIKDGSLAKGALGEEDGDVLDKTGDSASVDFVTVVIGAATGDVTGDDDDGDDDDDKDALEAPTVETSWIGLVGAISSCRLEPETADACTSYRALDAPPPMARCMWPLKMCTTSRLTAHCTAFIASSACDVVKQPSLWSTK